MSATCSCGCGRPIKGIRLKAANGVRAEVAAALDVLQATLDNDEAGDQANPVAELVSEGTDRLATLTRYLHGEVGRGDIDKDTLTGWLGLARARARSLAASTSGPTWEPDDPTTATLALSATRAVGVVTEVERSGWGNERVASLAMAVAITAPNSTDLILRRTLSISVVKAPRVGDRVEVAFDPTDPNRFVYRPHLDLGGGPPG